MFYACYLKKGSVLIPTLAKVRGGPHWTVEPVVVVRVTDTDALRDALREAIARGNPIIPKIPSREARSVPAALKRAGFKSTLAFKRDSLGWWLTEDGGVYTIEGLMEKEGYHGGKVTDPDQTETFPPGTSVETVIDRMIAILQSAHAR